MKNNVKITVFTPTYNREKNLVNLYRSLRNQTYFNFEWLIIDDGSIDKTDEIVVGWQKEKNNFEIRYFKQENGGKCRAINRALDYANGELFFTVDSDDILTYDALEKISIWSNDLSINDCYCGFAGNMREINGKKKNKEFEPGYFDGNAFSRYKEIDGERAMVFYTKIHRKYKYPEIDGEKFLTEAIVWNRMANDGYKIRYYNDIIWLYEYKEDGLTKAGHQLFIDNPKGYGLWLKEKCYFTKNTIFNRIKMYYSFFCDLKDFYDSKQIKEFINMPTFYYKICIILNRLI
ncbi:MAG: glycosyltransferase family A protein [Thomasclavelia sp.]